MKEIQYQSGYIPSISALSELYSDAGAFSNTKQLSTLKKALDGSRIVITAWDGNRLVGLLRGIGDGYMILYIPDIVVMKEYRRQGIGSTMLQMALAVSKKVRQKVLLADRSPEADAFFRANGFSSSEALGIEAYVKFEEK